MPNVRWVGVVSRLALGVGLAALGVVCGPDGSWYVTVKVAVPGQGVQLCYAANAAILCSPAVARRNGPSSCHMEFLESEVIGKVVHCWAANSAGGGTCYEGDLDFRTVPTGPNVTVDTATRYMDLILQPAASAPRECFASCAACPNAPCPMGRCRPAEPAPCPKIMFSVDLSASMRDVFDPRAGGPSRLSVVQSALSAIVASYGGRLKLGLQTFTLPFSSSCPGTANIDVTPGDDPRLIETALAGKKPDGINNAGYAMDKLGQLEALRDAGRPSYVVLIVDDGGTECGTDTFASPHALWTVLGASARRTPALQTAVVALGPPYDSQYRNFYSNSAIAGALPVEGCDATKSTHDKPCYYEVTQAQALEPTLRSIVERLTAGMSCTP